MSHCEHNESSRTHRSVVGVSIWKGKASLYCLNLLSSHLWEGTFVILSLYQKRLIDWVGQVCIRYFHSIGPFCAKPWGPRVQPRQMRWTRFLDFSSSRVATSVSWELFMSRQEISKWHPLGEVWTYLEISGTNLEISWTHSWLSTRLHWNGARCLHLVHGSFIYGERDAFYCHELIRD